MFEAQLLIAKATAYNIFSPWFPRQGDNLRATVELVDASGTSSSTKIIVEVVTKNSEDAGDGTPPVSGSISRSGADLATAPRVTGEWEGLIEELVRYRFQVEGAAAGDWVLFRMLPPVWFDDVNA